jgi:PAS domain-containing protein
MNLDPSHIAISITNHISAMVAYWDAEERCLFSNDAYREWFGKTPEEMRGTYLKDLLGPLYVLNLPYIEGALSGTKQIFERRIPLPTGGFRDSITTYTPDIAPISQTASCAASRCTRPTSPSFATARPRSRARFASGMKR